MKEKGIKLFAIGMGISTFMVVLLSTLTSYAFMYLFDFTFVMGLIIGAFIWIVVQIGFMYDLYLYIESIIDDDKLETQIKQVSKFNKYNVIPTPKKGESIDKCDEIISRLKLKCENIERNLNL